MTEIIYRITAGQFCGGLCSRDGVVISAAPFIKKFVRVGMKTIDACDILRKKYRFCKIELVHGHAILTENGSVFQFSPSEKFESLIDMDSLTDMDNQK